MIFVLNLHQKVRLADILLIYPLIQLFFLHHLWHKSTLFLIQDIPTEALMRNIPKLMHISFGVPHGEHCLCG